MGCPAGDVGSDLLPIFLLVNEEFDSIQVGRPVANDSADTDRCAKVEVEEFNIDLSSYS